MYHNLFWIFGYWCSIVRLCLLFLTAAGADENMDAFPQYSEMQAENSRSDVFPINVNLGDSALDYNQQEPPLGGMKIDNILDGRNERRTVRSVKDEGPRTLPRASATATLAKPLGTSGIDVVFATHWETPAANVRVVTEREDMCIKNRMEAAKIAAQLNDFDVEVVEENAARECLPQYNDEDSDAGQLTVYRFGLKCQCSNLRSGEVCSTPLPISHQSFPHRATEDKPMRHVQDREKLYCTCEAAMSHVQDKPMRNLREFLKESLMQGLLEKAEPVVRYQRAYGKMMSHH